MADVVVIAGTGTAVGKTWVAARMIDALRARGMRVAARKPVQSFDIADGPTDADVLAAASGEDAHVVCPLHRWYELPMAPPMAAEALGMPAVSLADLVSECRLPEIGLALVEGVGGPRSPLSDDADTADLADALDARAVVLVADAGLGTINAVVLSVECFSQPVLVFLNRFDSSDDVHARNRKWLAEVEELDVSTTVNDLLFRLDRTLKARLEVP